MSATSAWKCGVRIKTTLFSVKRQCDRDNRNGAACGLWLYDASFFLTINISTTLLLFLLSQKLFLFKSTFHSVSSIMGRSLFSQTYVAEPLVRSEPEPKVDICERYSLWNRFDPDSDDFFQNAQYEAFIDPVDARDAVALALRASESSSDTSSDATISEQGSPSPMAVGSDDPALLISDAFTHRDERNWEATAVEPVIPTSLARMRRASIESTPSMLSSRSPSPPATPALGAPILQRRQPSRSSTPALPPALVPALFFRPTIVRADRDGPLTNPHARISLANIDTAPVPITVSR